MVTALVTIMESNKTLYRNNGTRITESDTEATTHPLVTTYLILFALPFGVLLVVVPVLTVIIIILKNRKLREKNSNIFYVNLLIADMLTMLVHWIIASIIIVCYLLDLPNVNCDVVCLLQYASMVGNRLMFLPVVIN